MSIQSLHEKRKDDHITYALKQHDTQSTEEFQQTRFIHQSLSAINYNDVDYTTTIDTLQFATPFFINAMTGGSQRAFEINQKLAIIAKETNLALATGSGSIMIKEDKSDASFKIVRSENPNGIIFANIGANHSFDSAQKVVDILEADALQIHVNTAQEIAMMEGERNFNTWLHNIEKIVHHLNIPIIVKEVGFGMSKETIQQLLNIGVKTIDISGRGGTNFSKIENARHHIPPTFLNDWGLTTLESMMEAKFVQKQQPFNLIASGGIKNSLDITKCLALGANLVGMSGQLLHILETSNMTTTIEFIQQIKTEIKSIMTLLGAQNIKSLQQKELILAPSVHYWCKQRHLY